MASRLAPDTAAEPAGTTLRATVAEDLSSVCAADWNRLAGEDVPGRRARLIEELQAHQTLADLAGLLPEGEAELEACLAGIDTDIDALVEELEAEASRLDEERPEVFTFAVDRADADIVNQAVEKASGELTGKNRRGRALVMLAKRYLEG